MPAQERTDLLNFAHKHKPKDFMLISGDDALTLPIIVIPVLAMEIADETLEPTPKWRRDVLSTARSTASPATPLVKTKLVDVALCK
jgi:hypothetical protein